MLIRLRSGQLRLFLVAGNVKRDGEHKHDALQNVLHERIDTHLGETVEQCVQEDTAEHRADDAALAAGDTPPMIELMTASNS